MLGEQNELEYVYPPGTTFVVRKTEKMIVRDRYQQTFTLLIIVAFAKKNSYICDKYQVEKFSKFIENDIDDNLNNILRAI